MTVGDLIDGHVSLDIECMAGIAPSAHSVLTISPVDEPGHPTRVALDRVMAFLSEQLHP